MNILGTVLLAVSTVIFLFAASAAKVWALAPSMPRLLLVLALYTAGNLIMLRLIRDFGLGVSLSLSAVIQLVAVNVVAFAWFGERLHMVQGLGIVLAIAAVVLITLGPAFTAK